VKDESGNIKITLESVQLHKDVPLQTTMKAPYLIIACRDID